jgi:hypothetical protein
MSLDTILKIGKTFRDSPGGRRYHRFFKSIEDEIAIYKRNKDASGKSIETTLYELPIKGNGLNGFEFNFDAMKPLMDEAKIRNLLYLNFKTSDKDSNKKYLYGDIIYSSFKGKKGKTIENGNYRRKVEGNKKPGSFERCKDEAADLKDTAIGKFRECFERHLTKIEDDLLLRHPAVVIHFAFDGGKTWLDQEKVEDDIKGKLLESFVFENEQSGRKVFALNKTLFKTIKPPIWDKTAKTFKDPDGVGGVTPGFANKNTFKLHSFESADEVWNLMFAIGFAEKPLISVRKDVGIIALPKGENLSADSLLDFFKKNKNIEDLSEGEEVLEAKNEESEASDDWDSLFEPLIKNAFEDEVEYDVIFLKPKAGSSPAIDMVELASIKKSHLKEVHEKIRKVKIKLKEEFDKAFPKVKKPFRFDLKENFLNILTTKTKSEKKYQFHLLKVLPQIYLDAYYDDPVLLPAFVERTEYNIRNEERFAYNWFRFNFIFLSNIQKNNPLMEITTSRSYAIGKCLGVMARPFAAWRDDCPIKSFEKNYVGNLTRRIAYPEDLMKFSNFLNEKLAIHEKLYTSQQEASRQLAKELQNMAGLKYKKHECALGFFESYFEKQEAAKPQGKLRK